MAAGYINVNRMVKYHQGWLEHRSQVKGRWADCWCVLRGNILFLFSSSDTTKAAAHMGTLTITPESRLDKLKGNESCGYSFELHSRKRINHFMTKKFSQRELWKAFIEGIAKGIVPYSLDLPPPQIDEVRHILGQNPIYLEPTTSKFAHEMKPTYDEFDSDSGSFGAENPIMPEEEDYIPPKDYVPSRTLNTRPNYTFCSQKAGNVVPSWFFFDCTREKAERLLTNADKFENCLMRESSNETGHFVISKISGPPKFPEFTHFLVLPGLQGYVLEVQNPNQPMKTLSDVMDFFVTTSGRATTFPLTTDVFAKLRTDDDMYWYQNKIHTVDRDGDSGEEINNNQHDPCPVNQAPPAPHPIKVNRSESVPAITPELLMQIKSGIALNNSPQMSMKARKEKQHRRRQSTTDVDNPPPLPPLNPNRTKINPPPENTATTKVISHRQESVANPQIQQSIPPPPNGGCNEVCVYQNQTRSQSQDKSKETENIKSPTVVSYDFKKKLEFFLSTDKPTTIPVTQSILPSQSSTEDNLGCDIYECIE